MEVSVSLLPSMEDESVALDVAVVIDVLRATSVMATAIAANAARVITCGEVAQRAGGRNDSIRPHCYAVNANVSESKALIWGIHQPNTLPPTSVAARSY